MNLSSTPYRGRIAPSPSGLLHRGHARTFWVAAERCRRQDGTLVFRMEDLDPRRSQDVFAEAALEDLAWLGLNWQEGPDRGGPHPPYRQSERAPLYRTVWRQLLEQGMIYPSPHSRREIEALATVREADDGQWLFPSQLRQPGGDASGPGQQRWRFRVPDGTVIRLEDGIAGTVRYVAGEDFGDFAVWSPDGQASYELAVVVDDHAMAITEVVRGADLLKSTARQLLIYQALGWSPPWFAHCPLVLDAGGQRLSKTAGSEALRTLRKQGMTRNALADGFNSFYHTLFPS